MAVLSGAGAARGLLGSAIFDTKAVISSSARWCCATRGGLEVSTGWPADPGRSISCVAMSICGACGGAPAGRVWPGR